jgi:hypothetical protein
MISMKSQTLMPSEQGSGVKQAGKRSRVARLQTLLVRGPRNVAKRSVKGCKLEPAAQLPSWRRHRP